MAEQSCRPMFVRRAPAGTVVRVSPSFARELGLSYEELSAKPLLDWVHPDDRSALSELLDAGQGVATARHATRDGEWLEFEWRVRTHAGESVVLGLRAGTCSGSPEATADARARERRTMPETLAAMARIVEAKNPGMRCSVLLTNVAHDRVTVGAGPSLPDEYNAAVEGLRIGPGVGSCGTAAYWNVPVIVEDIAQDPLWRDLRGAAAIAGVAACWSHPITATDGIVLGAMALYDTKPSAPTPNQMDGLEIAARMVGQAIERDRLEEALRQTAKMKALGVMAGGIAHDFNNVLAAVLGNAELAMEMLPDDAPARQRLRDIVTASTSATELCSQMLAYAGRGAISKQTLEMNALVREISGLLRVAVSKKATLELELHEGPLGVLADRSQLRQIILNLINNASDAIGDEAGRIIVRTCVDSYSEEELYARFPRAGLAAGEFVEVSVSDSGIGMNAETQAEIFDPFFTSKPAGTGLGLAAVQGIVRRHDGAIAVESVPGAGSTFTVLLPRTPIVVEAPRNAAPARVTAVAGTRVLVVDDEPLVLGIHGDILEAAGYTVLRAAGGRAAIDLFAREGAAIACVLLDYSMPDMNGEQVFQELRALHPAVSGVLTSGFTEQEFRDRLHGAGFAAFVQKPAKMDVLLRAVATAVRSSL